LAPIVVGLEVAGGVWSRANVRVALREALRGLASLFIS
jgi:hypothetical protein